MQHPPNLTRLDHLRHAIARIERSRIAHDAPPPLPFGLPPIDAAIGGGLARGALHEIAGDPAAAAHFAASILARMPGKILWVLERRNLFAPDLFAPDLFAPGLAGAGLHPDRVIYAEASRRDAPLVMEEGLRHRGLAGVVAEWSGRVTLTASRRLHLAAEAGGVTALLIRRTDKRPAATDDAIAAATRWRIGALPSPPPIPDAPHVEGLGRARWRLELTRCRGGRTGTWIVEACDASGRLALVAPLADGSAQAHPGPRRAAA